MNVTVNTAALAKKLRLVEKIIAKKTALPILSNVFIHASDSELTLATTNLETSMTVACAATVHIAGTITAPVRTLLDVLSEISEELTHLTVEKDKVRVASGAFKMRLQTLPPDNFPTLPTLPPESLLLPGDEFKRMIQRVRYAISETEKRYFMNGALLSLTDTTLALVTTDGKRLSITATARAAAGANVEILIPTKTLDLLLTDDTHDDLLFNRDSRQMFFASDDAVLTSRTIDGTFPDYKRTIPRENTHVATIPRELLLSAIKRVSNASPDTRALTFTIEPNLISLNGVNAQIGDAVEHLTVVYDGPSLKFTFPWTHVAEFLNAAESHTVRMAMKDERTSVLWSDGAGSTFMNVTLPMRL